MNKEIKKLSKKYKKKIGKQSISKIKQILLEEAEEIIRIASRNSDFSGRKTIKLKDIAKNKK